MCLLTHDLVPSIATEDLIVYKRVTSYDEGRTFQSSLYCFDWKRGVMNTAYLGISRKKAADCCPHDNIAQNIYSVIPGLTITEIAEGFHATVSKDRLRTHRACDYILEFKIPAGAEVMTDSTGLIVSNQMMML